MENMMTANLSREEHLKRLVSRPNSSITGTSATVMNASTLPISSLPPPMFRINSIIKFPIMPWVKISAAVPSRNSMKRLFSPANSESALGFAPLACSKAPADARCARSPGINSSAISPSSAENMMNETGTAFALTRWTSMPKTTLHSAYDSEPSARARLKLTPHPQLSI